MRPPLLFFAAGDPKGQPRLRARALGKFAQVYNPKTADDWKLIIRHEAQKHWDGIPFDGPLAVNLTFYFDRPKAHFRANGALKPNAPLWHTHKPDRDNSDKAVLDALSQLGLWRDDCQVCDGRIKKCYRSADGVPGVMVVVKEAFYD